MIVRGRFTDNNSYGKPATTASNVLLRVIPIEVAPATMAMDTIPAIMAYSIAVAPPVAARYARSFRDNRAASAPAAGPPAA